MISFSIAVPIQIADIEINILETLVEVIWFCLVDLVDWFLYV